MRKIVRKVVEEIVEEGIKKRGEEWRVNEKRVKREWGRNMNEEGERGKRCIVYGFCCAFHYLFSGPK